jgi:hypothetical protein
MGALVRRSLANPDDGPAQWLTFNARNALTRRCFSAEVECGDTIEWMLKLIEQPARQTPLYWQRDPRARLTLTMGIGRLSALDYSTPGDADGLAQNAALIASFGYAGEQLIRTAEQTVLRAETESWDKGYFLGLVAAARRDTAGIRSAIRLARQWAGGVRYNGDPDTGSYHHGLERALGGWAFALAGDTARAITEMKAGIAEAGYSGDAMHYNGTLVRTLNGMLAAWPRTRDEGIARIRINLASVGYYWPWMRLQLARALDARGDSVEAAEQYRRFAALWSAADPELRHFGEKAAARAVALRK